MTRKSGPLDLMHFGLRKETATAFVTPPLADPPLVAAPGAPIS